MAYSGYLIKLKGGTAEELPLTYVGLASYKVTPNQRMESSATRATTGVLRRTTVDHTASKIEFETPNITNKDVVTLNTLIQGHFTDNKQRKLDIEYYDPESDTYKDATVYMPDVDYSIDHIDQSTNTIYYSPIRYAFIEY